MKQKTALIVGFPYWAADRIRTLRADHPLRRALRLVNRTARLQLTHDIPDGFDLVRESATDQPFGRKEPSRNRAYTLEWTILGRNDDYEPGWSERLFKILDYNTRLFARSPIDFQIAFVEWNPPFDRPVLSPSLVSRFANLRAIIVDSDVHAMVPTRPGSSISFAWGLNACLRTSRADYSVVSGGDVLVGSSLAEYLMGNELDDWCLYRAIRCDVDAELDPSAAEVGQIERMARLVRVHQATSKPYSNASGDFLMMSRRLWDALRGLHESSSHLYHLDSRCCWCCDKLGADSRLIGYVLQLDHSHSYVNNPRNWARNDYAENLPYSNGDDWGLATMDWQSLGDRLSRVSAPQVLSHA